MWLAPRKLMEGIPVAVLGNYASPTARANDRRQLIKG
jgi:hypothetical protein